MLFQTFHVCQFLAQCEHLLSVIPRTVHIIHGAKLQCLYLALAKALIRKGITVKYYDEMPEDIPAIINEYDVVLIDDYFSSIDDRNLGTQIQTLFTNVK